MEAVQTKQQQMYVDIVQLVGTIAREGFGIDIIHNPLFSGTFQKQLEKHHQKLVDFILKYVPVEPPPVSSPMPVGVPQGYTYPPGYMPMPGAPPMGYMPQPGYAPQPMMYPVQNGVPVASQPVATPVTQPVAAPVVEQSTVTSPVDFTPPEAQGSSEQSRLVPGR